MPSVEGSGAEPTVLNDIVDGDPVQEIAGRNRYGGYVPEAGKGKNGLARVSAGQDIQEGDHILTLASNSPAPRLVSARASLFISKPEPASVPPQASAPSPTML